MSNNNLHEAYGKIIAGFVSWCIILVCGMLTTYYGAYVLGYHWQWFLTPDGFDVPSMRARIGIMLITSLMLVGMTTALTDTITKYGGEKAERNERHHAAGRIFVIALIITISWGMGALWNWWLG